MQTTFDAIIIGSGAGGGPLAFSLSRGGATVLVLEKGPHYRPSDYYHDEIRAALEPDPFVPSVDTDPHVIVDQRRGAGDATSRSTLGWIASCVGGGTAHMGGAFFRFHPDDFRLASRFGPYEEIADWPYRYDELEPYYCEAEWHAGVAGPEQMPFSGARSRPYPMAPHPSHAMAEPLDAACRQMGLAPFPTPYAINSVPYDGRPACRYCDYCAGCGCPIEARGSVDRTVLAKATATGRCEIRTRAMVRDVLVSPMGRAGGCIYIDGDGLEHRVTAPVVCICCSAVESARLLLLSKSTMFPDGLGNRSGLVGRHLQFHTASNVTARFSVGGDAHGRLGTWDRFLNRSVLDHYFLPRQEGTIPKGGVHVFETNRIQPVSWAQRALNASAVPLWGQPLKAALRRHFANREVVDEIFHDFLPNARTFVGLDPDTRDARGLPVARITIGDCDHHAIAGRWLSNECVDLFERMGADEIAVGPTAYLHRVMVQGTCRAGLDPADSVLDSFCESHDVPNLFVVDGSFMATSGGAPTTLTIMANSFRTADHILRARGRRVAG